MAVKALFFFGIQIAHQRNAFVKLEFGNVGNGLWNGCQLIVKNLPVGKSSSIGAALSN